MEGSQSSVGQFGTGQYREDGYPVTRDPNLGEVRATCVSVREGWHQPSCWHFTVELLFVRVKEYLPFGGEFASLARPYYFCSSTSSREKVGRPHLCRLVGIGGLEGQRVAGIQEEGPPLPMDMAGKYMILTKMN
jgi:hypothetical protein